MDDLISRQTVIDLFNTFWRCFVDDENEEIFKRQILELPPVQSERKKGHWIDTGSGQECSECGEIQYGYDSYRNYCAYCGASMKEVDDVT